MMNDQNKNNYAKEGYYTSLRLITHQASHIWRVFSSMLTANALLIAVAALQTDCVLLRICVLIAGLILCVGWALICERENRYYRYYYDRVNEFEEATFSSKISIFCDGTESVNKTLNESSGFWFHFKSITIHSLMRRIIGIFIIVYFLLLILSVIHIYKIKEIHMEFNMEPSTFYYVLGTIPQVLAAMAAIIGVFTIFRIENYKRYLIGDGKSAIERWGNPGYKFNELAEDAKQRDRMRDAVGRENIAEIKKVLELLSKQEQNEGYTLKTRPAGLQFLYNERFCKTENEMNTLKKRTIFVAKISIITIIISIISLSCTDIIFSFKYPLLRYGVLWMNVLLLIISVVAALNLISRSFSMSVPHETNIRS